MMEERPVGPEVDFTPPATPPHAPIGGRYVTLEPLSPERHGDDLWRAQAEDAENLWRYRFQGPFPDRAAFDDYLKAIATGENAKFFAYVDRVSGEAKGLGSFMCIAPAAGSIEMGAILIGSPMQRTRAGTEALILMIRWAFEAGYRRMEWTCDPHNEASMKAAERLGFTYECVFRRAYVSKGRNRDKAYWAIVDTDWPGLSAAYDAWLDPANFDASGVQTSRLSAMTALHRHARADAAPSPHQDGGFPVGAPAPGWTPPPRPPADPMEGRYARIERFDMSHVEALHEANRVDDAIWDYMPQGPFPDSAAYRDWMAANALGDDPMFHTIFNKETGRAEGVATYLRIAPEAGSIEVGYITYSPALQRTRAGSEAMILMMERAFALGYRRYEWKCNALNAPSRRLALRLGMSYEGVFRQAGVVKRRNRDTAWYACADSEWPAIKSAFDQWLDPENFDADGRQKASLSDLTAPILVARE